MADAKRIQQDYLISSSPSQEISKPFATSVTVAASNPSNASSSTNSHLFTAISSTHSPTVVTIPAKTNAFSTTVQLPPPSTAAVGPPSGSPVFILPPPSPFAGDPFSAEASPVVSTLRSTARRQSTSVVFPAATHTTKDSTPPRVGPAKAIAGGRRYSEDRGLGTGRRQ